MYRLDPTTKKAAGAIGATVRKHGPDSPEALAARQHHAACTAAHYARKLSMLGPVRAQDRALILTALDGHEVTPE